MTARGALHVMWDHTQVAMICFLTKLRPTLPQPADQAPHARTAVIPFFICQTGGPANIYI